MKAEEEARVVAIVDDDESVLASIIGLMTAVGCSAAPFISAEEFLKPGEQERAARLIADCHLPGVSGLELGKILRSNHHRISVISNAVHGNGKMRMQALRVGAVEFLTKPFDDEVLLDRV